MEKVNFIEAMTAFNQNEDVLLVSKEVNELKIKFEDYLLEEERKIQVAELEGTENDDSQQVKLDLQAEKSSFFEVYQNYKEKRKALIDVKNREEESNLNRKKVILRRFNDMIQHEENIGAALKLFTELKEEWKLIGDIPRQYRAELQNDFSKLVELFFYNIKIYRELKDHDLKRNQQLKEQVIQQLEELKNQSDVKVMEHALKNLQHDWDEIGPVVNEAWEELKNSYWEKVRALHAVVNQFYDEKRTQLAENIQRKQELIEETKQLVAGAHQLEDTKVWEKLTADLISIQERWKGIGFGPKKENDAVWIEFRKYCDEFFNLKKDFYAIAKDKFNEVAEKKQKLIDQATSLKDSMEWKTTADTLIQLQKQWKALGNAGPKLEQKLWRDFRDACDAFFTAKQNHFNEKDKALIVNLEAKQALIQEIENYKPSDNKEEVISALKDFSYRFNELGLVPLKDKDKVYVAYKSALDKHYAQIKLEGAEREQVMFNAKLDALKGSADAGRAFQREKSEIRQQIEKLKHEILQLENNLGFFARSSSKNADALRKDVEGKIGHANTKIETLKQKLKLIPNE